MSPRRRGRLHPGVIALAVGAVITLLCCAGMLGAAFLTDVGGISGAGPASQSGIGGGIGCGERFVVPAGGGRGPVRGSVRGLGQAQMANASAIIGVGAAMKVPPRGWVVAIATAMQESRLTNLGHLGRRNDHDSIGLFQQRPSMGWGSPAQLRDPAYTARKFFDKLKAVEGWQSMSLTDAAQRVQRSAYPDAYAKHEPLATDVVNALADGAARAAGQLVSGELRCAEVGQITASGWASPAKALMGSGYRTAQRPGHHGVDMIARRGTPVRTAAGGVVTHIECDNQSRPSYWCDRDGSPQTPGCGWYIEVTHADNVITRYCHLLRRPTAREGQRVPAGYQIGVVGTSGNSSGPHLHFEVHLRGDRGSGGTVDPVGFLRARGVRVEFLR
ncbi:hypothetical protein GCM10010201_14940 [Pilimelia columellifera subsp. columellifera]|uniref:M23ase beta-sheet core domain-containing protein n=1 Tax=Pilimelia columellifera subsp. columellifera TaxID=706583 RepID=A0ABP6AMP3_9ACTN